MTIVELIVVVLAGARLTRLITSDALTEGPRTWLLNRLDGWPRLQYLITCDWCASMYASLAVVAGYHASHANMWFMGALAVLAASYVTGALASVTGGE